MAILQDHHIVPQALEENPLSAAGEIGSQISNGMSTAYDYTTSAVSNGLSAAEQALSNGLSTVGQAVSNGVSAAGATEILGDAVGKLIHRYRHNPRYGLCRSSRSCAPPDMNTTGTPGPVDTEFRCG
jgi:hypothetical protein